MCEHDHDHGSCRDIAEQLLRYRDGDLGPDETEYLRAHLHCCPRCVDFLSSYEEVVEVLGRLQPVRMPSGLLDRLKQGMEEA